MKVEIDAEEIKIGNFTVSGEGNSVFVETHGTVVEISLKEMTLKNEPVKRGITIIVEDPNDPSGPFKLMEHVAIR